MKKLYFALLFSVIALSSFAQNVNYTTEIIEFYQTGCNDGAGSDEEPTWKAYTRDNVSTIWEGGVCHFTDGNIPIVYIPASNTVMATKTNTSATLIDVRFEAWEDDCDGGSGSDRCSYNSSCLLGTQEDDCLEFHDPLAGAFGAFSSISFRDDPQCTWNEYTYNVGDFGLKIRIKWEYSDFTAGSNIDACTSSISLAGAGSGEWSVGSGTGGIFTDQTDPNSTFIGTPGETYVLDWNTVTGCQTPNSDNITVNLFTLPDPQLISDQDPICEGEDISFSAEDGNNYAFAINTIANELQNSGSDTYTHSAIALTDSLAFVTVTNSNGCEMTDSILLNVIAGPIPTISRTGSLLSTGTYTFYQWYLNGMPISGATSQTYLATTNGTYTVQVIGADGCIGESAVEIIANVGLTELSSIPFVAYPNPVSSILNIKIDLPEYLVSLTSIVGQTMATFDSPKTIDVSDFSAGIYLITVSAEGNQSSSKIIIE